MDFPSITQANELIQIMNYIRISNRQKTGIINLNKFKSTSTEHARNINTDILINTKLHWRKSDPHKWLIIILITLSNAHLLIARNSSL